MNKFTSTEEPAKVVTVAPKRYLRFDIEKVDDEYRYNEVELPVFQWDRPHLISAVIRAKYSQDDVEAILLNHGDGNVEHEEMYEELQQWRKHAKEVVSEVIIP